MKRVEIKKLKKSRVSKKIKSLSTDYRVLIYKSLNYDYLSVIDPVKNNVINSISTKKIAGKNRTEKASALGDAMAKYLLSKKINKITFDRRGYKYHGRIKAMCDAMRKSGIKF
jgi:large subunit ribosomal protein L18